MARRLRKSNRNRMIFGVAGGLADYFGYDPMIIRAAFIVLGLFNGIGVFVYLILALIMPRSDSIAEEPLAVVKDNLRTVPREAREAGKRVATVLRGQTESKATDVGDGQKHKEEETTV